MGEKYFDYKYFTQNLLITLKKNYFQVLDCMIEQIEQRFSQETQQLLISYSCLQPEKHWTLILTLFDTA